ncbi:hypothetical protein [Maribacter sp. 2308TA10-17]|uniref:hypothetical protein n=1 Tax=Maribacter sp. 2308TA10-17 TaxID=3386276 RepID=UPI0039BCB92D
MEIKNVTAIWILSCNDSIPQITYQGIGERINGISEEEVKNIVRQFPELFQEEIPTKQLDHWKSSMSQGLNRPKWIAKSSSQEEDIKNLKTSDLFRNRFRNSIDAQPVSYNLIEWGINYINEYFNKKERNKNKTWQRIGTIVLPLISLLIAGYSIQNSSSLQLESMKIEKLKLNREIIIPEYKKFVSSFFKTMEKFDANRHIPITKEMIQTQRALSELAPYIDSSDHKKILVDFSRYFHLIQSNQNTDSLKLEQKDSIVEAYLSVEQKVRKAVSKNINAK